MYNISILKFYFENSTWNGLVDKVLNNDKLEGDSSNSIKILSIAENYKYFSVIDRLLIKLTKLNSSYSIFLILSDNLFFHLFKDSNKNIKFFLLLIPYK